MPKEQNNSEKKTILSTQGYRGTRDFFPEEQRVRSYIYAKFHKALQSFGYEEYDGPFVEPLELYAAKSSEEIVREQLYSFTDRGNRSLAIRPEMTPTLARMIATKQKELLRPVRWYSIPTCMRFERPQRGRLREFDQLNVDIFGGNPIDEDIEILLTCIEILKNVGAAPDDFQIKINHRGIVNSYMSQVLFLPPELNSPLFRLLDKRDKLTDEDFLIECQKLSLNKEQIENLEQFLKVSSIEEVITILGKHAAPAHELKQRLDLLKELTQSNSIIFSPFIMRGFDYYTGLVFEVFDTHPDNRRALFGGGRYDNLVGAFGGEELAGIGYGVSDVAIVNFMEVHKLLPSLKKETEVCVLRFTEADRLSALKLANSLRTHGIKVESPVTMSKFGKQIQTAEKVGAKAIIFQGEEELKENAFSAKWLQTGLQEKYMNNETGIKSFISALSDTLTS